MNAPRHLLRLATVTVLLSLLPAAAQVAAPTPPDPASVANAAKDDVVEISPFVVNSDQDVGYLASNTLAGSRLNTSLKDTAASISILTEEFMRDIAATNLTQAMEYSVNAQVERADGGSFGSGEDTNTTFEFFDTFRVRGQKATVARNYFAWTLPTDTFNIERVEDARGPNSILFGVGSAAGIISSSTKQAITGRSFRQGTASYASYDSYRGTIDVNQAALNGKFGVRLNAVYNHSATFRHHAFDDNKRIHVAAKYIVTPRTRIRAEYETGEIDGNVAKVGNLIDAGMAWMAAGRPTFATPVANTAARVSVLAATRRVTYIGNSDRVIDTASSAITASTGNQIIDTSISDRSINTSGPGGKRLSSFNAPAVYLEHQLGRKTFLEVAYNHQDYTFTTYQPFGDSHALAGDPNQFLRNGEPNPYAGRLYLEGTWVKRDRAERSDTYRGTFSTELDAKQWGNYRVAALGEYEVRRYFSLPTIEVWANRPFNSTPENAANHVFHRTYVTEGDWASYYTPGPAALGLIANRAEPVSGQTLSSHFVPQGDPIDTPSNQKSGLFSGQARYFGGRLVVGVGYRQDKVHIFQRAAMRDPVTNLRAQDWTRATIYDITGETRTVGVVGHITRAWSLMYNESTNIALPAFIRILPDSGIGTAPRGNGRDVGFGLSLFDGTIYARGAYFQATQKGAQDFRFGGTQSNPTSISGFILNALRSANVITQAEQDAHTINTSGATFDRDSTGYELTVTANPTKNWRFQANYSITDAVEDNIGPEVGVWMDKEIPYFQSFNRGSLTTANANNTIDRVIELFQQEWSNQKSIEKRGAIGNRRYKVNAFTRYSFSDGVLKGVSVGGGYRHQSKMLIGKHATTGALLYGNSYWIADAMLGYRFRNTPFLKRLNIQLNVANVFDDQNPLVQRILDNGTIRSQAVQAPRTWRLTTDFAF